MGQWGRFSNSTRPITAQHMRSDDRKPSRRASGAQPPTAEALAQREGAARPYTRPCRFFASDRKLGSGAYGTVLHGTDLSRESPVAIKFIPDGRMKPASLEREVSMLHRLSETGHPSLLRFYGHMRPDQVRSGAVRAMGAADQLLPKALDDCHALVMELADGGEIFAHVVKCGGMAEAELAPVFAQLVDAVRTAHRMGIAHRDLKLENCLLSGDAKTAQRVKLIDWGLAHQHALDGDGEVVRERLHSRCGSRSYMAPEVTNRDISGTIGYDAFASDVWSLGVCLFAMLLGFFPFEQANPSLDWRAQRAIEAQEAGISTMATIFSFYPERELTSQLSPGIITLLDRMLVFAPGSRAALAEVCASEWLAPHLDKLPSVASRHPPKTASSGCTSCTISASSLHTDGTMQRTRSVSDSTACSVPDGTACPVATTPRAPAAGFSLAEQFASLAERLRAERQDSSCTNRSHASSESSATTVLPLAAVVGPRQSALLEPPPPSPKTPIVVDTGARAPRSSRTAHDAAEELRRGVLPEKRRSNTLSSQDLFGVAASQATEPQPTVVVAGGRRLQRESDGTHSQLHTAGGFKCEVPPAKSSRGSEMRSSSTEPIACVPTSSRGLAALLSRACLKVRSPRRSRQRGSGEGARPSWVRTSVHGEEFSGVASVQSPVSANL